MIKKSILLVILIISSLYAENIFDRLPYGIEPNKEIPKKVYYVGQFKSENKSYFKLSEKFTIFMNDENKDLVEGIWFDRVYFKDSKEKLPSKWRKQGLFLCSSNSLGTSFDDALKIIKQNDAKYIKEDRKKGNLSFEINGKFRYSFSFWDKKLKFCKGGLGYVQVDGKVLDEEY